MSARPVELIRKATGEVAPGQLHSDLSVDDVVLVERAWSPERARLMAALKGADVPRSNWPQSLHWDWSRKAPDLRFLMANAFGIVCDGDWQGVLMTKTVGYAAVLAPDQGKPVVYVDFVETAPWNWSIPDIGQVPRFTGVGSVFIREAVQQSVNDGFHGRVGLHALPQAELFYSSTCGMTRVGPDPSKQNLVYFEFTRAQATAFLD